MYLIERQVLKHLTKSEFLILRELSHAANALTNESIYNIRQHFFATQKFLSYGRNNQLLKGSPNYRKLNSNMSQQILKEVNGSFESFFALLKLAKSGKYDFDKIKLPHYMPKDGFATLIIGFVRIKDNKLKIPYSNSYRKNHKNITITIPPNLVGKRIKEIRIIPKAGARFFEVQYVYEADCIKRKLNNKHALALDLGVNNLITAVTNTGRSFIIDEKKLKSINQYYNKENAKLQSVKDKQNYGSKFTKRQLFLAEKRNNRVNDYISKAAKYVIDYCISNDIGILVLGYNKTFQNGVNLGKVNNQNFVNLPFGKLCCKLKYLCELNDITFVEQEESYTSKASFWDKDKIPVYGTNVTSKFSGKRIRRGIYKTSEGKLLNADVNAALNILRKSNVVSLQALYRRGEVDTPLRIRVA